MNIAICDDEERYRESFIQLCNDYAGENATAFNYIEFTSGEELMVYEKPIDIILLDIEMKDVSGITLKNVFQKMKKDSYVIFITSHDECIERAFGKNVIGFLRKPVSQRMFNQVFSQAVSMCGNSHVINLSDERNPNYMNTSQIVMIESTRVYSYVISLSDRILVRKSLAEWEEELRPYWFYRVNKSCIVNMQYIKSVKSTILMENGAEVRIGRAHKEDFMRKYNEYCREMAKFW